MDILIYMAEETVYMTQSLTNSEELGCVSGAWCNIIQPAAGNEATIIAISSLPPSSSPMFFQPLHTQLSFSEILNPAIELAESGYPVAPLTALHWQNGSEDLAAPSNVHGRDVLLGGKAPQVGDIMKMPHLAKTLRVCDYKPADVLK